MENKEKEVSFVVTICGDVTEDFCAAKIMFGLKDSDVYTIIQPLDQYLTNDSPPTPAIEGKEEGVHMVQTEQVCLVHLRKYFGQCPLCPSPIVTTSSSTYDGPTEFSIPTPPAGAEDHVHVQFPSGAVARMSPDASPELLDALNRMCEIAKSADIPLTGDIKVDGNPLRNSTIGTLLAGAEGEGEIPEDELDADRLLGKLEASRKYNAALMKQLSAAQAKIAALEQTIREQKEWINGHL